MKKALLLLGLAPALVFGEITLVDWIQPNGHERIVTDYARVVGTDKIEVKFSHGEITEDYAAIFSCNQDLGSSAFDLWLKKSGRAYWIHLTKRPDDAVTDIPEDEIHILTADGNAKKLYLDGVEEGTSTVTDSAGLSNSMLEFFVYYTGGNYDNGLQYWGDSIKLYYCKIWDKDGNLLHDFRPAVDTMASDYRHAGLYDLVKSRYFTGREGVGFIYSPNVPVTTELDTVYLNADGETWSDGLPPHAGAEYVITGNYYTAEINDTDYTRTWKTGNTIDHDDGTGHRFGGDRLVFGTESVPCNFYDLTRGLAYLDLGQVKLVNGTFYVPNLGQESTRRKSASVFGDFEVLTTEDNPFVFTARDYNGKAGQILFFNTFRGGTDAVVEFKKTTNRDMCAVFCASNPDYHGRFVVDNAKIYFLRDMLNGKDYPAEALGSEDDPFDPKALILKNNGAISFGDVREFNMTQTNKGIWIEDVGKFEPRGSFSISAPVGGGDLTVNPFPGYFVTLKGNVSCSKITLKRSAVIFGNGAEVNDTDDLIHVTNDGSYPACFGTDADRSARLGLDDGCGFYYQVKNIMSDSVPVITLKEGSELPAECTELKLWFSTVTVPIGIYSPEWFPVLKIPVSVKADLSGISFVIWNRDRKQLTDSITKTVTTDGMHTVYVKKPSYYVVHPDNRPEGHVATYPYTSWETAATDIQTALDAATTNLFGGTVFVDTGTYELDQPLAYGSRWYKNVLPNVNGSGNFSEPIVCLVGKNRETGEADAEHTVLALQEGVTGSVVNYGASVAGERLSTMASGALANFTITGGNNTGTDGNWNGGGGLFCWSGSEGVVISNVRFIRNQAVYGGAMYARACVITNCYFEGNHCTSLGWAISNPQGSASLGSTYVRILDCKFVGNWTSYSGNMLQLGRNSEVRRCEFVGNGTNSVGEVVDPAHIGHIINLGYYGMASDLVFRENVCDSVLAFTLSDAGIPYFAPTNFTFIGNNCRGGVMSTTRETSLDQLLSGISIISNTCNKAIVTQTSVKNLLVTGNTISSDVFSMNALIHDTGCSFDNITVADNIVGGRSFYFNQAQSLQFRNSIFYRNTHANMAALDIYIGGNSTFSLSNINTDNPKLLEYDGGVDVFSGDPKFVDAANGDYHLRRRSPCRDRGVRLDWMDVVTDRDGNPRCLTDGRILVDSLPDLGCYECMEKAAGTTLIVR